MCSSCPAARSGSGRRSFSVVPFDGIYLEEADTGWGRSPWSLRPGSRAPHQRRERKVNPVIEQYVIDYRLLHPGVGKEAIKPAMDHFCRQRGLKSISESTIGRVICDLKARGKLVDPRQHLRLHAGSGRLMVRKQKLERKQRRKDYMPQQPGDLVQIDSISYVGERLKRYFVTAVDLVCGFGFAYCYPKLNSLNARDFYQKFTSVAPFTVKHIQTDNGSEFQKHFQASSALSPSPTSTTTPITPKATLTSNASTAPSNTNTSASTITTSTTSTSPTATSWTTSSGSIPKNPTALLTNCPLCAII